MENAVLGMDEFDNIFCHLDTSHIFALRQVCKQFRERAPKWARRVSTDLDTRHSLVPFSNMNTLSFTGCGRHPKHTLSALSAQTHPHLRTLGLHACPCQHCKNSAESFASTDFSNWATSTHPRALTCLVYVDMVSTKHMEAVFETGNFSGLQKLEFYSYQGFAPIKSLTKAPPANLRVLRLSGSMQENSLGLNLAAFSRLETLILTNHASFGFGGPDPAKPGFISSFPGSLRALTASGSCTYNDPSDALHDARPPLESLELADDVFGRLDVARFPSLKSVDTEDRSSGHLAALEYCTRLESLTIAGRNNLDHMSIPPISSLRELRITSRSPLVSVSGLGSPAFAQLRCLELARVGLSGAPRFAGREHYAQPWRDEHARRWLQAALPNLTALEELSIARINY